ncbi:MAG: dTDP-4-dehydrorhamnose reductase [Endomicrobium sp.]|jgi:dTDP-4-dehydrorhamnose reductase|nr:dTDP-4-dehydrorhamnose reductase [Endomicrobium sp.]
MFLITGAKGQLGRCFADILNPKQAYFYDSDEMNITNIKSIQKCLIGKNIAAIINCAAYTNVDKAEDEKEKAYAVNVVGVENLAKTAEEMDIPIIHISTDYVFGEQYASFLLNEESLVSPLGVYGKTKLYGENTIKKYAKNYVIIRTSWLYSEYEHNFLKTVIKLASERQEIKIVSDQIGTPTYAPDLARAIVEILSKLKKGTKEIYHFSNEGVCSWYDFAYEIVRQRNLNCNVLPIKTSEYPTKAKRPFFSVLDKSKIKKEFNLQIDHWIKGIEKCLKKLS